MYLKDLYIEVEKERLKIIESYANGKPMQISETRTQNGYSDHEYICKLEKNLDIVTKANNDAQIEIELLYKRLEENKNTRLEILNEDYKRQF